MNHRIEIDGNITDERFEQILSVVLFYMSQPYPLSLTNFLRGNLENITPSEYVVAGRLIGQIQATNETLDTIYSINNYQSCLRKN